VKNVSNRLKLFNQYAKFAKMTRIFAMLTGLTLFIFISTAQAGQNCNTAASNAKKGCNSDFSGCPEQQAAGTAAQSQMSAGSGATAAAGSTSAAQCQAQQTQSNNLSNLTNLVGQCCASAIKKCDQACTADAKTDPQSQVAIDNQNKQGCDGLTANATAATGQSAEQAGNAGTNSACNGAQSAAAIPALPALPAAPTAAVPSVDPSALAASTPLPNCAAGQQLDANNNCVSTNQVAADSQAVGPATPIGTASSPNGITSLADGSAAVGGAASAAGGGGSGSGGSGGFLGGGGSGGEAAAALKASEVKDAQNRILLSKLDPGGGGGGGGSGGGERFGDSPGISPFKMPGLDKKKNPAGMTVKAVDGITAPTGATLFEKISQQYQRQKPKLFNDN
jgi:hypothetical protein